jgi:hypothetical protein
MNYINNLNMYIKLCLFLTFIQLSYCQLGVLSTPGYYFYEASSQLLAICEPGYYCLNDGVRRQCPPGRFGSEFGISSPRCTGVCEIGYFCEAGSISSKQNECGGSNLYCPIASHTPQIVDIGYYSVDIDNSTITTRGVERRCEPGHYCVNGIKYMCKAGFYGGEYGHINETCSGLCNPGYFCPMGSLFSDEVMCGDASRYCPGNDAYPKVVDDGFYSIGGNESTRVGQSIATIGKYAQDGILRSCRAGYYGSTEGLKTPSCSGSCVIPGYYCTTASISPFMNICGGDNVICPARSVAPLEVSLIYFLNF